MEDDYGDVGIRSSISTAKSANRKSNCALIPHSLGRSRCGYPFEPGKLQVNDTTGFNPGDASSGRAGITTLCPQPPLDCSEEAIQITWLKGPSTRHALLVWLYLLAKMIADAYANAFETDQRRAFAPNCFDVLLNKSMYSMAFFLRYCLVVRSTCLSISFESWRSPCDFLCENRL